MICPKCTRDIPPRQLACSCFIVRAMEETERMALENFKANRAPLYRTSAATSGFHLLPKRCDGQTSLCRIKTYSRIPATVPLMRAQFVLLGQRDVCIECAAKATRSLGEAPEVRSR